MPDTNIMDGFRLTSKAMDIVYSDILHCHDNSGDEVLKTSKQCFAVRNLQNARWNVFLTDGKRASNIASNVSFPKVVEIFEEQIVIPDNIPENIHYEQERKGEPHYKDHPDYDEDLQTMERNDLYKLLNIVEI